MQMRCWQGSCLNVRGQRPKQDTATRGPREAAHVRPRVFRRMTEDHLTEPIPAGAASDSCGAGRAVPGAQTEWPRRVEAGLSSAESATSLREDRRVPVRSSTPRLIGDSVTSVSHHFGAPHIAASIDYQTVRRPAGLPDDMQPLTGRFAAVPIDQRDRRVQGPGRTLGTGEQTVGQDDDNRAGARQRRQPRDSPAAGDRSRLPRRRNRQTRTEDADGTIRQRIRGT